jgi:hypothetical protein
VEFYFPVLHFTVVWTRYQALSEKSEKFRKMEIQFQPHPAKWSISNGQ